ncbi:sigma-70 family RNA polymerase sigma factor [Cellulomonas sp. KRMCY2]|uniref:sigma-70 family RNA polymerase sigma factor n=1 Tax=Cellulomonas sp. KRMCY2 TaxID=1304865 RepID=UPI00350EF433
MGPHLRRLAARTGHRPSAYARRTLANLRIDTWRKHRNEVLVGTDEFFSGTIASAAQHHAERDALVRALLQLTERRRRVVVLRYLLDLSEREVADDLNISVGTVKSTASRGLDQLRALLGEQAPHRQPAPMTARDRNEPQRVVHRGPADHG